MNELELNPTYHVPEERAELFTADTVGSTEHEYLALLAALVIATKPNRVLETGAETGVGTEALMAGIEINGFGELISVELNPASADLVQKKVPKAKLVNDDSLHYLANYDGKPFDFVFLDSHLPIRAKELELLIHGNLLSPGAFIAIHDTSRTRPQPDGKAFWDDFDRVDTEYQGTPWEFKFLEFPLSRGLILIQATTIKE